MSIVTVHGPNTMFTSGAGVPVKDPSGVVQATQSPTNGLSFAFSAVAPGARPAADFDWTFTGPGAPAAQADKLNGTVVFTGPGAGTIVCTVAAGAGPPAGGIYTIPVTAVAGAPRDVQDEPQQASQPAEGQVEVVDVAYDPGAHNVTEVVDFARENPDAIPDLLAAERAGKDRSTLISQLEELSAPA